MPAIINDKGAWILQLKEVSRRYSPICGAAAILAGYWTEGVGVLLMQEGGVQAILVATDAEVYATLQPYLDTYLGADTFLLDAKVMRKRYPRPWDLANCLIDLQARGMLTGLAESWLHFMREEGVYGRDLIQQALDRLLAPLKPNPAIQNFEISLQIDTGNVIFDTFTDFEELMAFLHTYYNNPDAILRRITPKPAPPQAE